MPVEVTWDNPEKTIIKRTFTGQWTWDEFYTTSATVMDMMSEVEHPVYVFADFLGGANLPTGSAMTHARNVIRNYPDNWAGLIVVSNKLFIGMMVKSFGSVFASMATGKVFMAESLEEAYTHVKKDQAETK
jgi:hypothetical protein